MTPQQIIHALVRKEISEDEGQRLLEAHIRHANSTALERFAATRGGRRILWSIVLAWVIVMAGVYFTR